MVSADPVCVIWRKQRANAIVPVGILLRIPRRTFNHRRDGLLLSVP